MLQILFNCLFVTLGTFVLNLLLHYIDVTINVLFSVNTMKNWTKNSYKIKIKKSSPIMFFLLFMAMVILSALVEIFSVSHMRDFSLWTLLIWYLGISWLVIFWLHYVHLYILLMNFIDLLNIDCVTPKNNSIKPDKNNCSCSKILTVVL